MVLPLEPTRVRDKNLLTRYEWLLVELLKPLRGHVDLEFLVLWLVRCMPHLVCMFDDAFQILRVHGVEDCEEVVARWAFILWIGIWHILHKLMVFRETREDILD